MMTPENVMSSTNQTYSSVPSGAPQIREAAVLTRAVENVFRKLIRMLIGRMSLKKLQELIQIIFVQETEAKLKKMTPEKNVALADLALLTGVDTRTIKKTRKYIASSKPIHKENTFLDGFMPMFKIFDLWMNDERFFDAQQKIPKKLKIEGEQNSFSQLAKLAMQSRGLSAGLVLKRLEEIGVVDVNVPDGTVRLKQEDNIFISKDELDSLEVGFTAIGHLADTIHHNIQSNQTGEMKYFQRGSWDFQFDPRKMNVIRQEINSFLTKTDSEARMLIDTLSEPKLEPDQRMAGMSMFYFEEEPQIR
jgi:hypothetical protein